MITKEDLKQELEKLDGNCLDLVLRLKLFTRDNGFEIIL